MLAMIWTSLSSKLTNAAFRPAAHPAATKLAARLVLAVPGEPEIRMLLPRRKPPPRIASRRATPDEIRSEYVG